MQKILKVCDWCDNRAERKDHEDNWIRLDVTGIKIGKEMRVNKDKALDFCTPECLSQYFHSEYEGIPVEISTP